MIFSPSILPDSRATTTVIAPPTHLRVFGEDYSSSNLTAPLLTEGYSFNISIQATDIPPVIGQESGGISGFDISLAFNSSILKVENLFYSSPDCSASDGCIFDLPSNDTFVDARTANNPAGTARLALAVLGPTHEPDTSSFQNIPVTLFRVQFLVVGRGVTPISIEQNSSQLIGFSNGCGVLLPFDIVNGSLDNRPPYRMHATPPSAAAPPGQSVSTLVNVTLVNSAGYGTVNFTLSNYVYPLYAASLYAFNPRSGSLNSTIVGRSFTSTLTINTNRTAPAGSYPLTIIGVLNATGSGRYQYNLNFTLTITGSSQTYSFSPIQPGQQAAGAIHVATATSPLPDLIASFSYPLSATVGTQIVLSAVAVWCSSPPYTLHWDFGDGSSATANPVSHTYSTPGTYTVRLNVINNNGDEYSSARQIIITENTEQASGLDPVTLTGATVVFLLLLLVLALLVRRRRSRFS